MNDVVLALQVNRKVLVACRTITVGRSTLQLLEIAHDESLVRRTVLKDAVLTDIDEPSLATHNNRFCAYRWNVTVIILILRVSTLITSGTIN
jgi:hypothetical protein